MLEPLSAEAFASFGLVIEDPNQSSLYGEHNLAEPELANRGTALKYVDVSSIDNLYNAASSQRKSRAVMNMFLCSPRQLRSVQEPGMGRQGNNFSSVVGPESEAVLGLFDLTLMERHPYTTQTFIPIGLAAGDTETAYLIVVAPTLPAGQQDRGMPDVFGVRAFFARGSQAVTYSAATWHAPMIVIGVKPIAFVVVQYSNGVAEEDCEEIELITTELSGITITVPAVSRLSGRPKL